VSTPPRESSQNSPMNWNDEEEREQQLEDQRERLVEQRGA
jgi:hypothetical protein